jgi:16S rRNA (cytosine967-C5)-methyltransferase
MTPNARYASAIECLDRILNGEPAEKTLTNWARSNRYAGSKARAAVRDIVCDCLRQKRSLMHLAGFDGARGVVSGHILTAGGDVDAVFTGERFAAAVLNDQERTYIGKPKETPSDTVQLDVPDWIMPKLQTALADDCEASLRALQNRAPLDLRVNGKKTTLAAAQQALAKDDIETVVVDGVPTALRVTKNPRRVALSQAYLSGLVEIQDAGSQAVVGALPLTDVHSVLDYCAGGGGKTLGMAAVADGQTLFDAYDQNKARMKDLPERAKRSGVSVQILQADPVLAGKTYDLVLLDVPCSGTGAWRRNPDGKWRLTEGELQELLIVQADILSKTEKLVSPGGTLAYVTCSLLQEENEVQVEAFLKKHPDWSAIHTHRFHPSAGTDGFFLSALKK